MTNPKISILIPVYNGGEYLKLLIKSIQNQTFSDFEVVCVEDGSSDGSLEYLQNCAKEDNRIKIINRKIKGGTAIKGITYGLEYCSGDYFYYLSQDDLLDEDALEKLYLKAIETNADIIIPNMIWYRENSSNTEGIYPPNNDYDMVISNVNAFLMSLDWQIHGFYLQKMSFAKKIGWDDLYYNSCEYGTRIHLYNAKKIVFVDTNMYYRQDNKFAITRTKMTPQKMEIFLTDIRLLRFMIEQNLKDKNEFVNLYSNVYNSYTYYCKPAMYVNLTKAEIKQFIKILNRIRKEYLKVALLSKKFKFVIFALKLFFKKRNYVNAKYYIDIIKYKKMKKKEIYISSNTKKRELFFNIYKKLLFNGLILQDNTVEYYSKVESARQLPCKIGRCTYCGDNVLVGSYKTEIGSFCSIANNVTIGPAEHPLGYMSTSPFFYLDTLGWNNKSQGFSATPCKIGNDVWIGSHVFIKNGVKIGHGAVVGAGAVVVKDVEPYSVVGGVPAKLIKYRFEKDIIKDFLELQWWNLDDSIIKNLPFENPKDCINILKDFVRKDF